MSGSSQGNASRSTDDDLVELISEFNFEPEDDDWREINPAPTEINTGVGDYIKPADLYHVRGCDFGLIININELNLKVAWVSDSCKSTLFVGDVKPVARPTDAEIEIARSSKLPIGESACKDRSDSSYGKPFSVGTLVLSRAIMCRHGAQLGTIEECLDFETYSVKWYHIIGRRSKDSRRSFTPISWKRTDLVAAETSWIQMLKPQKSNPQLLK